MKQVSKETWKKYGKKAVIILLISVVLSLLAEVVWNLDILTIEKAGRGIRMIPMEQLYTEGFDYENGVLKMTGTQGVILIDTPCSYVNKLEYTYQYGYDFTAIVRIHPTADAAETQSFIDIADGNNRILTTSEVKVEQSFDHVDLIFPEGIEGIEIHSISYDNSFHLSGRRMLAVGSCIALILFILLCGDIIEKRLEYGFLAVGLTTCIAMVFTFPAQKVSWDEAFHFRHAYEIGLGYPVVLSPEVQYYGDDGAVASLLYPRTAQEFNSLEAGLNQSNLYDKDGEENQIKQTGFAALNDVGHIASAVGITIARLFHFPLTTVYRFGKLFNALLYIGVVFFAIRRAKIGKGLLTTVALMPTPLFLASSYSYDATLNAFAFLGLSYLLSEFAERDSKITWKRYAVIMGAIFIASCIKLLYAPLFLLLLFLPKEKFKDKKTMYLMKLGILAVCGVLLAIMLLPTLLTPSQVEADSRGGATSTGGQLAVIFGNPVGYAKLLVMQILYSAVDFTVGNGIFGTFAHYGYFPFSGFFTVLMVFMAVTDTDHGKLRIRERIGILAVVMLIVCFIWTAMYISFTPVGAATINGVQGRYFIPVVIPLLLALQSGQVENRIPKRIYYSIALGGPMLLTYSVILYKVLANAS